MPVLIIRSYFKKRNVIRVSCVGVFGEASGHFFDELNWPLNGEVVIMSRNLFHLLI